MTTQGTPVEGLRCAWCAQPLDQPLRCGHLLHPACSTQIIHTRGLCPGCFACR